jgi:hypothetical protein
MFTFTNFIRIDIIHIQHHSHESNRVIRAMAGEARPLRPWTVAALMPATYGGAPRRIGPHPQSITEVTTTWEACACGLWWWLPRQVGSWSRPTSAAQATSTPAPTANGGSPLRRLVPKGGVNGPSAWEAHTRGDQRWPPPTFGGDSTSSKSEKLLRPPVVMEGKRGRRWMS